MQFQVLRVYFKAAVLVPFYVATGLACLHLVPTFFMYDFDYEAFSQNAFCLAMLQIPFLSGIIGIVSMTVFFNLHPKVARNRWANFVTWFLVPYSFIAWLLNTRVDWRLLQYANKGALVVAAPLIFIAFLHVIGLAIAYVDFRATVVLQMKEAPGAGDAPYGAVPEPGEPAQS